MKLFKKAIAPLSGLALFALASSAFAVTVHVDEGSALDGSDTNALAAAGTAVLAGETSLTGTLSVDFGTPNQFNDEDVFTFTLDGSAGAFTADISSVVGVPAVTLVEWDSGTNQWRKRAASDPDTADFNLSYTPAALGLFALIINTQGNDPKSVGVTLYSPANDNLPWTSMANAGGITTDYTVAVSGIGAAAVPVPAAVWLFGSGLLGLVGVARRKA